MAYQIHTAQLLAPTVPALYDRMLIGFRANVPIPEPVGKITDVQVTNKGSLYTTVPTITAVTGAAGSGAVLAGVMELSTFTVTSSGTGYAPGDLVTLAGATGAAPVISIASAKLLSTSAMVTSGAGGYLVGDQITLGGGGSQANPAAIINVATTTGAGVPASYSIATAGVFTATGATLSQVGTTGGGTGVTVTATYGANTALVSIGGFMTVLPVPTTAVTQSSASGSGSSIQGLTTYDLVEVNITSGGAAYTPDLTVSIGAPGAGGVQATALASTDATNGAAYVPFLFSDLPATSAGVGTYGVLVTGNNQNTTNAVVAKTATGFTVVQTPINSTSAPGGTIDVWVFG